MRFPLSFTYAQFMHRRKMAKAQRERYPTVLMLEPLYTCNLACLGCSVERYSGKLQDRMPVEQCFKAADDCGAPIVNICGGEPTLYPELKELVDGLIARDKHIILCTNALKLDSKVYGIIKPTSRLFLMIHLDGMKETHDFVCNREGVFDKAVEMIKQGKSLGYRIYLNATVYTRTNVAEIEELCKLTNTLKADGILVSPGYQYAGRELQKLRRRVDAVPAGHVADRLELLVRLLLVQEDVVLDAGILVARRHEDAVGLECVGELA